MGKKARKTRTSPSSATTRTHLFADTRLITWLVMSAILLLGFALRAFRLGESPGGFLVFNENFYLRLAAQEAARVPFSWVVNPIDVNNPPLYAATAAAAIKLLGSPVIGARLVSVLAGVATILVVFLLGRELFDTRTGLVSAAMLAVMPGVVLVNHNIQVDSLFVALLLAGVYFYVRALHTTGWVDAAIGGVLLGLSVLTKQPAVLALVALALWRTWVERGLAWVRERVTWVFAGTTLAVGASWYALQIALFGSRLFTAMGSVSAVKSMSDKSSFFWTDMLLQQFVWLIFPVAAVVAVAGLVMMGVRRTRGDIFVLVFFACYLAYYIGYHKHTYYLLPVTPFAALAIGRLVMGAFEAQDRATALRVGLSAGLVAFMAIGSCVMMTGHKWGRWAPADLALAPDSGYSAVRLYYDPILDDTYESLAKTIDPRLAPAPLAVQKFVTMPRTPGTEVLFLSRPFYNGAGQAAPAFKTLTETRVRLVLFGFALDERSGEIEEARSGYAWQNLANTPWIAEKVGPLWRFGFDEKQVPTTLALYR